MGYKRVVVSRFGGPDVLRVVDEPEPPQPAAGEVRVRVLATSAAFTDTMVRRGIYPGLRDKPPFTPGYDMVGVVDAVGEGVDGSERGRRVADLTVTGAYAEYVCVPRARLVPVPDELDAAEAVSLVLTYVTAYQMLYRAARAQQGQRILVHGAGGAVGSALLQLGKLRGLEMYGTASETKRTLVTGLGGQHIDYHKEDFVRHVFRATGDGVDAVFDAIGGEHFRRSFRTLRKGGTLVAYGFYSASTGKGGCVPLDFMRLALWHALPNGRSTTFYSIGGWRKKHPDWFRDDLCELFRLLSVRKIEPVVAKRMPLEEAARAHELVEHATVGGKIVLVTGGNG